MKTRATTALLTLILFFLVAGQGQAQEPMQPIHSISGSTLKVIQAALPKFEEHDLDLEKYLVFVVEDVSSFVVVFDDPKRPAGRRGSSPNLLGFEVEISKEGLQVVRANFVK